MHRFQTQSIVAVLACLVVIVAAALLWGGSIENADASHTGNNAAFRNQWVDGVENPPSITLTAGQSYDMVVRMGNTGSTTWNTNNYKLGSQNPQDNRTWGVARVDVSSVTEPGTGHTFRFTITAPETPGDYNLQWRMLQEGVEWFGQFTDNIEVIVEAQPEDDARVIDSAIPASFEPDETKTITFTMENNGNTWWYHGTAYQFRRTDSSPFTLNCGGVNYAHLPNTVHSVGSGHTPRRASWSCSLTAPSSSGDYTFSMRMRHTGDWDWRLEPSHSLHGDPPDSTFFFGETLSQTITVESVDKPDLVVSAGPSLASGSLEEGENVTFEGTIHNQGAVRAEGPFRARFRIDDNNDGSWNSVLSPHPTISNLNVGQSQQVTSGPWQNIPAGTHRVQLCADRPNPVVDESNEGNNCSITTFTVQEEAESSNQTRFDFQVDDNPGFASPEIDRTVDGLDNPPGTQNNQSALVTRSDVANRLNYGTQYFWRARVWDSDGNSSGWVTGSSFTTPDHEYPTADFDWSPQNPAASTSVDFEDTSTCYNSAGKTVACASWNWTFEDANPSSSTEQDPTTTFLSEGEKAVSLTVSDGQLQCTLEDTVAVDVGLPEFREVSPTGILDRFLHTVASLFAQ